MNTVQMNTLVECVDDKNVEWVEAVGTRGVATTDPPHLIAAKVVINLRRIEAVVRGYIEKRKAEIEKYMKGRKTPYEKGHIRIQWIDRITGWGFNQEEAAEKSPARYKYFMEMLEELRAEFPQTSRILDIREIKAYAK